MGAQLRPDARQKDGKLERLRDIVVRPGIEAEDRVRVAVMAGQHQDRALDPLLAHLLAELATVHVGQPDIEDDKIEHARFDLLDSGVAIGRFEHVEIVGQDKLLGQRLAKVVIVIHKKNFLQVGHVVASVPAGNACSSRARQDLQRRPHAVV